METNLRKISCTIYLAAKKLTMTNVVAYMSVYWLHQLHSLYGDSLFKSMGGVSGLGSVLLFLSAKVNEQCRNLEEIVVCFYHLASDPSVESGGIDSRSIMTAKALIIEKEQLVLRALSFDTVVELPHKYLLNFAKSLQVMPCVVKLAWTLLNDCSMSGSVFCFEPPVLACCVLSLAMNILDKVDIAPRQIEDDNYKDTGAVKVKVRVIGDDSFSLDEESGASQSWWRAFGVTDELYKDAMEHLMKSIDSSVFTAAS